MRPALLAFVLAACTPVIDDTECPEPEPEPIEVSATIVIESESEGTIEVACPNGYAPTAADCILDHDVTLVSRDCGPGGCFCKGENGNEITPSTLTATVTCETE
jgi:hypothetical protein